MKEHDPDKGLLNLRAKQSVYNDPKHRCATLTATTDPVSNDARGIQRFCSHIIEIATTTRAVLVEGHKLLPLLLIISFCSPFSCFPLCICL